MHTEHAAMLIHEWCLFSSQWVSGFLAVWLLKLCSSFTPVLKQRALAGCLCAWWGRWTVKEMHFLLLLLPVQPPHPPPLYYSPAFWSSFLQYYEDCNGLLWQLANQACILNGDTSMRAHQERRWKCEWCKQTEQTSNNSSSAMDAYTVGQDRGA